MTDPLAALEPAMRSLLADLLRTPSVSGSEGPLTRLVADRLAAAGLRCDLWQSTEADVAGHAVGRHLPLDGRPTLVATLPGTGGGRSLLFNAHADVVAAPQPERWTHPPFAGVDVDGVLHGRGACDVKGPLVTAVWALLAMRDAPPAGDVSIELVPGEEDCVTLGTLTSVARGHTADGAVVLEPTECLPRNASRPGVRFEIACGGVAVHGTVKWLGRDAIQLAVAVCGVLRRFEAAINDRSADPLFAPYPFARPVTVDTVRGGTWQGMVADHCLVAGYLELLPADEPIDWQRRLVDAVLAGVADQGWPGGNVAVTFPEVYSGHCTDQGNPLCTSAVAAVEDADDRPDNTAGRWRGWSAFNSGCEAGLRANLLGTPTLVWGPGSLARAHAIDESIAWAEVRTVAGQFVRLIRSWSGR